MRAPRVATQQTTKSEPCAFERTVDFQSLDTVVAACGIMPAHPVSARQKPQPRRDAQLIETDEQDEDFGHDAAKAKSQNSKNKIQK